MWLKRDALSVLLFYAAIFPGTLFPPFAEKRFGPNGKLILFTVAIDAKVWI